MLVPLPDYAGHLWVKVVGMLQQNWALIAPIAPDHVHLYFINDLSVMFDARGFESEAEAVDGLKRNGFRRFAGTPDLQAFLLPPAPPFHADVTFSNPVYSSGRHWR